MECTFWEREAPRIYKRRDCGTVRVVGDRLRVTYNIAIAPPPVATEEQIRTVSAWGDGQQSHLARLKVLVVGAGSVGGFIAEALARTRIENVSVMDFDKIEPKNLDRLCYASRKDVGLFSERFAAEGLLGGIYDEVGFRAALDCDVIFSCVDRPWGRQVLNLLAYAHLIPVVDGGIAVGVNRKKELVRADWRAHVATVGRRCLECLGQYDPGHVQLERQGQLDDPLYVQGLGADHPLKAGQNVFAFSMACASLQMLQFLALVVAPLGQSNPGTQLYHFVGGYMEEAQRNGCDEGCFFPDLVAQGDQCIFQAASIRCDPA